MSVGSPRRWFLRGGERRDEDDSTGDEQESHNYLAGPTVGPIANARPSAMTSSRPAPAFAAASRAWYPLIVTSSPAFTVPGLKPLRMSELGVLASNDHFSTLPSAPVASRKNHECGFSSRTCVMTPFTVMGLSESNSAANE